MKSFVIFNTDGTVKAAGRARFPPPETTTFSPPIPPQELAKLMLVPRPQSPAVETTGTTHSIADCPLGTVIEIIDNAGGELMEIYTTATDGETVTRDLPDPGQYEINVKSPDPYLPTIARITVPA